MSEQRVVFTRGTRLETRIHCVYAGPKICHLHNGNPAMFWDDADAEKFAASMRDKYPHKKYRVKDIRVL